MYHTLVTAVPGYENTYVPRLFDALIVTILAQFGAIAARHDLASGTMRLAVAKAP
jgi:hypothetical protein